MEDPSPVVPMNLPMNHGSLVMVVSHRVVLENGTNLVISAT